jgi:hypothetical protein
VNTGRSVKRGSSTVDTEIAREQVQVERKMFSFDLRENPRGRFLRVTEDVGGRRDTIIIPATGLTEVREMLDKMIEANEKAGPSTTEG